MRVLLFLIFAFGLATQGSFIDSRDQQQYTLLTIGSQQWLKENLRFVPSGKGIRSSGGYYSASELKSVCPEGFRIPSVEEWKELIQQMPGKRNSRKGRLVAVASLQEFGLQLGGQERMDDPRFFGLVAVGRWRLVVLGGHVVRAGGEGVQN